MLRSAVFGVVVFSVIGAWMGGAPASARAEAGAVTPLAHVEVRGSGPVNLVLIPGHPCDWTVWDAFMTRNADRYTMYAITLPGYAGSTPPPFPDAAGKKDGAPNEAAHDHEHDHDHDHAHDHDDAKAPDAPAKAGMPWYDNAVEAISLMLRERGIKAPVLVGHSMGGQLAVRFAIDRPREVARVVVIDGFPSLPMPGGGTTMKRAQMADMILTQMRSATPEQWRQSMEMGARMTITDPARAAATAEMFLKTEPAVAAQYASEMFRTDLSPRLPDLRAPTLVIAAINNPVPLPAFTPETLREHWNTTFSLAPAAQVVFFENTRHFIMEERPAELDRAIAQFIAGEPVEGVAAK